MSWIPKKYENNLFYCRECNKVHKCCYEFDGINFCNTCLSEDIKVISEKSMIRSVKMKKLNEIENNE